VGASRKHGCALAASLSAIYNFNSPPPSGQGAVRRPTLRNCRRAGRYGLTSWEAHVPCASSWTTLRALGLADPFAPLLRHLKPQMVHARRLEQKEGEEGGRNVNVPLRFGTLRSQRLDFFRWSLGPARGPA
jgi:hypothetical protein